MGCIINHENSQRVRNSKVIGMLLGHKNSQGLGFLYESDMENLI